ncbi:U3 small nucleolar RNA-associated protein 15 homolog [Anopheles ziemanni]|uniref:U3 small nucleolar RNA-associated protein 15 homolog n=1 Tax=Anopheles coustani TaxID=139045 RepID=UPI002659C5D4|nr:U3 small nucleolar RNA-associated protein 15 homolog [Anopheles coustani]XP_058172253.1 U3 small nucleolar RNA-associated protein 15 homolog [Anopheles ziemanni]
MAQFKKTESKIYSKTAAVFSPDTIYWKRLGVPTLVKEFGAVDYIDFSPVEPHLFAVTASVRVQIYNPITKLVVKNIGKFQEGAHGGSFRKDGNLLVAGDDLGKVRLFDVSTKSILRFFEGHTSPVYRTFFTADGHHVASFSDDRTVRFWDIATEKHLHTFTGHEDYVRAGCTSPISPNIIMSGGYDRKIRMYDTRVAECVLSVDHGSPVESLVFLPSGGIFISAGGTSVNVYDALGGGKKLAQLSQHHKTVTCLQLASDGKRLLSGSLDRHVKVYDIATYQVVHTIDSSNAILSLGISKNDDTLVTGLVDGLIAIYRREIDPQEKDDPSSKQMRKSRYRHIFESTDEQVKQFTYQSDEGHDRMLRKYEYKKALDAVMHTSVRGKWPEKTVALIKELIRRHGLERAVVDRDHDFLVKFLHFLTRHIGDYRFTPTLVDAANILLDVYEEKFKEFADTEVGRRFVLLVDRLQQEETVIEEFLNVQGMLDMISIAADTTEPEDPTDTSVAYNASMKAKNQTTISVD